MSVLTHALTTGEALLRLAIARGSMLDDVTSDVYLEALDDIAPALVSRACQALAKESRGEYQTALPSVGTIRERCELLARADADDIALAKLLPAPVREEDELKYFCLECRDEPSGWRSLHCQGRGEYRVLGPGRDGRLPVFDCARQKSHPPHPHVDRCRCYETNPNIQAHRRRMQEAQRRRASGGDRPA